MIRLRTWGYCSWIDFVAIAIELKQDCWSDRSFSACDPPGRKNAKPLAICRVIMASARSVTAAVARREDVVDTISSPCCASSDMRARGEIPKWLWTCFSECTSLSSSFEASRLIITSNWAVSGVSKNISIRARQSMFIRFYSGKNMRRFRAVSHKSEKPFISPDFFRYKIG